MIDGMQICVGTWIKKDGNTPFTGTGGIGGLVGIGMGSLSGIVRGRQWVHDMERKVYRKWIH